MHGQGRLELGGSTRNFRMDVTAERGPRLSSRRSRVAVVTQQMQVLCTFFLDRGEGSGGTELASLAFVFHIP